MIDVHVNGTCFSEGVFCVVHVLRSINLVELSTSIADLEHIVGRVLLVLAEVSANEGGVGLRRMVVKGEFENLSHSEEGKTSPSDSHLLEVAVTDHKFSRQPVASEPGHALNTSVGFPKSGQVPSVSVCHVGRQKESHVLIILVGVIPVKTVVLNLSFLEPRSS